MNKRKEWVVTSICMVVFIVWTILVQGVDVQSIGPKGSDVGFASLNGWFHALTGVHMRVYTITDWLGLVPLFVCMIFAGLGCVQLVKRRSLLKVDGDILILGVYYIIVVGCYILFELVVINYRPVLINGILEASYPSSTTLLVMCVMPTLVEQLGHRVNNVRAKRAVNVLTMCFMVFMVGGRTLSGVHWLSDIIGSILLSASLFYVYKASVDVYLKNRG